MTDCRGNAFRQTSLKFCNCCAIKIDSCDLPFVQLNLIKIPTKLHIQGKKKAPVGRRML